MLGFCILAPVADGVAKLLGTSIDIGQLVLYRFGLQALLLLPFLFWLRPKISNLWAFSHLIVLRTILHMTGIAAMITGLQYLPLADAIAIAFVLPFIMLILGHYFMGDHIGLTRAMACLVGFIGTLLVVQPSFQTVGWPALLPLVVAVVFAFFILVTRQVSQSIDPISLQAVSGVISVLIILPGFWLFGGVGSFFTYTPLSQSLLYLVLLFGALGTFIHLLMTYAAKYAPSATLAPMQYLEIPIATIVGWVMFRDFPNGLALLGIAITMSAGLYIIFYEGTTMRNKRRAAVQSEGTAPAGE